MALKNYETVFILTPVLSEQQMKDTVDKFRDVLKKHSAEIVHEENWGLRKLAYSIQKKANGFYYLLEFKAEPNVVAVLETEFKRDERVMRFLTIALDEAALAYANKRKKGFPKKETKPVE